MDEKDPQLGAALRVESGNSICLTVIVVAALRG